MEKLSINLLQAELIVKQPLWNLQRVLLLWLFCLILTLSGWWWADHQYQLNTSQYNAVSEQNTILKAKEEALKNKINNNKVNPELQEQLNSLTLLLENKKDLLRQLTDSSSTQSVGFSMAMTELAKFHNQNISLQSITINGGDLAFVGLARYPEAVPTWLAAFEQSVFLSGKSFSNLNLGQNEQNLTTFTVSSNEAIIPKEPSQGED